MKRQLYYIYWFFRTLPLRRNFPKYNVLSVEETITDIVTNKKSLSRFGDGEFRLVNRERNIVFQSLSNEIADRLSEVLNSKLPNHLVAIPSSFVSVKEFKREAKIHWLHFINQYGDQIAQSITNKKYVFGNAFISRFYIDYQSKKDAVKVVRLLKEIWNLKDVVIVEGEFSRLGVGNDLFGNAKTLQRIICPSKDAFSKYDTILEIAKLHGKHKLILIALGPTASVLAYDLAKSNYWAIDIGHVDVEYMWMLQNAKNKIPIKGRYVAEAASNENFEIQENDRELYRSSIICNI
ncbi:SP_1767 family glycosyltransferase [Flavobacterium flavipallidum]|uniref:SP_1767 family glycosyltransferase n=1 Tax=Flavobacterium flavipallidum TaxID=3139140 RepID=A0ABU9HJ92_9FLAO